MKVLQYARLTGKTTECRKALKDNAESHMIVRSNQVKNLFSKNEKKRIHSWRNLLNKPLPKGTSIIIDEPAYMPYLFLKGVEETYDVFLVAGTPRPRQPNELSWFFEKIQEPENVVIKKTMYDANWINPELIKESVTTGSKEWNATNIYAEFVKHKL